MGNAVMSEHANRQRWQVTYRLLGKRRHLNPCIGELVIAWSLLGWVYGEVLHPHDDPNGRRSCHLSI